MNDTIHAKSFDKGSDTQSFTSEQYKQIAVDAWKGIEKLPPSSQSKCPGLDGDFLKIPPLFEEKVAASKDANNQENSDLKRKPRDTDPGHNPDKCFGNEFAPKPPATNQDWAETKKMLKAIDALPGSENLDPKERKLILSMLLDNNHELKNANPVKDLIKERKEK